MGGWIAPSWGGGIHPPHDLDTTDAPDCKQSDNKVVTGLIGQ